MGLRRLLLVAALWPAAAAGPAAAHPAPVHTVVPGESLWAISQRTGVPVSQLAAANGRPQDGVLPAGAALQVPAAAPPPAPAPPPGAAAAPAAPAPAGASPAVIPPAGGASAAPVPPPPGPGGNGRMGPATLVPIHSPLGPASLAPGAARNWEALRQASIAQLGVDLYPQGPMSGYRTYEQQVGLWRLYRSGAGQPAALPGTSAHGLGRAIDLATPEMRRAVDRLGGPFGWRKVEAPEEWAHVNYTGP